MKKIKTLYWTLAGLTAAFMFMASFPDLGLAGLAFDLAGVLYSNFSVGNGASVWMSAVIGLMLITGSYVLGAKWRLRNLILKIN